MSRGIVAALALAFAGAASLAGAEPAAADSFSFGYSSGHRGHYGDRHHYRPHRHGPPPRVVYHAPPRPYYHRPPPRVIYSSPPVVYHRAPPTVIYADPPPVIYAPPVVANNLLPGGPLQPSGQYCREYQSSSVVGGRQVHSYGTACQQPDGSWRIIN